MRVVKQTRPSATISDGNGSAVSKRDMLPRILLESAIIEGEGLFVEAFIV